MCHVNSRYMAGRLARGMRRSTLLTWVASVGSDISKHYARVRNHLGISPASLPPPKHLFFSFWRAEGRGKKRKVTLVFTDLERGGTNMHPPAL